MNKNKHIIYMHFATYNNLIEIVHHVNIILKPHSIINEIIITYIANGSCIKSIFQFHTEKYYITKMLTMRVNHQAWRIFFIRYI